MPASSRLVAALSAMAAWPVASQQRSRRNAMVASSVLAQRRAELADVERFLATRGGDDAPSSLHPGGARR